MVHNHSIRSSVSATVSAEWKESLQQPLAEERLRTLERQLILPTTFTGFLWLLLTTLLVGAGMVLLVFTSVQTFELRQQLAGLTQQHRAIERQNAELIWQIAQHSSLAQIRQRAEALGYQVPTVRHFVTQPTLQTAVNADSQPITTLAVAEPQPTIPARPNLIIWIQQQLNKFSTGW